MGVSTDAMLIYGYVWEDEHDLLGTDEEEGDGSREWEWDEIAARKRGIASPWDGYPDLSALDYDEQRRQGAEWTEARRPELDAWHAARKAIREEYGVEIDHHGSDQWSVPVVKIEGAGHTAARGYPHQLTAADLAVGGDWDARLRRFTADLGIDTSGALGPGWFLASWWG